MSSQSRLIPRQSIFSESEKKESATLPDITHTTCPSSPAFLLSPNSSSQTLTLKIVNVNYDDDLNANPLEHH